ncbi:cell division topological specificity factor-like protein, chloroplastic [Gossypium australe]|uniref:Cell division topological specificity factor-like protein, chloroplastic n=1 Tax=Gossypium australe TaxID=47621 RepID=A0A5B6WS62_9ROSI|nr:cell division topological specificity factor-like protein, chloroplastic [Gossypium australe]
MAISGNLSVAATLASYHHNPSPSSTLFKDFTCFMNGRSSFSGITLKWTGMTMNGRNIHDQTKGLAGILGATRRSSNANIAKQRLKMLLLSDRCAVSDEEKQKIVKNIVRTLSDFVEMESKDKRVKAEYQEVNGAGTITNIEYKDAGERSGCIDVKFDFYVPDE